MAGPGYGGVHGAAHRCVNPATSAAVLDAAGEPALVLKSLTGKWAERWRRDPHTVPAQRDALARLRSEEAAELAEAAEDEEAGTDEERKHPTVGAQLNIGFWRHADIR